MALFQVSATVAAGTSQVFVLPDDSDTLPITLQLTPGSGGTAQAYLTCSPFHVLDKDTSLAAYHQLFGTAVSTSQLYSITTPVSAIKIEATTAAAVVSIMAYDVKYGR